MTRLLEVNHVQNHLQEVATKRNYCIFQIRGMLVNLGRMEGKLDTSTYQEAVKGLEAVLNDLIIHR